MSEFYVLDDNLVNTAVETVFDDVRHGVYDPIMRIAAERLDACDAGAFMVPSVKLVLDATFGLLEAEEMQEYLTLEVLERQALACSIVNDVMRCFNSQRVVGAALHHSGIEQPFVSPLEALYGRSAQIQESLAKLRSDVTPQQLVVRSMSRLTSLAQDPFADARLVVGGALRFLNASGDIKNQIDIIVQSTPLLAVSGLNARLQGPTNAALELGAPYYGSHRFQYDTKSPVRRLRLTDKALEIIAEYSQGASGCPAGKFIDVSTGKALLTDEWERFVNYLAPDGATVLQTRMPGISPLIEQE